MKQSKDHRLVRGVLGLAVCGILLLLAGPAFADVPVSITQQGRLLDDGEPMTGTQTLEFELYDAQAGGDILWSDVIAADLDENGVYTEKLGNRDNPIDATILQEGEVFLQLTVDDQEFLPRVEMTSVPFAAIAQTADVAQSVADGGVTADALADGAVTSDAVDSLDWDKITDVPSEVTDSSDTLAELNCSQDDIAVYDGQWSCAQQQDTTYDGSDFALSDQLCSSGQVIAGINTDGTIDCVDQQDTTYDGTDFALSGEGCSGSQVAAGINTDGTLNCIDQQDTTYDGTDFALSGEGCSGNQVAAGINSDGTLNCIDQQDTTYSAGTGIELASNVFSADVGYFDGQYLRADGDIEVPGDGFFDGDIGVNVDGTSTYGYLMFGGTETGLGNDPRLYHSTNSENFYLRGAEGFEIGSSFYEMDLEVYGDMEVHGDAVFTDSDYPEVGINTTDPQFPLHVQARSSWRGLGIEVSGSEENTWSIAPRATDYHLRFGYTDDGGSLANRAYINSDSGEYYTLSDRRLKEDVEYLDRVLDDVLSLRPAQYLYEYASEDTTPTVGFLAQEVEEVFPHLVGYDAGEDQYALSYGNFGVLAIQAIQEQQEIIDATNAEVDELRRHNEELQSQVDKLEQRLDQLERQL